MVLSSSSGPDITIAPGGCADHSDWYGPCSNMVLQYLHGCKWQPRHWASSWPLGAIWAADVNTDSGCGRSQTQMVLGMSLGRSSPWPWVINRLPHQPVLTAFPSSTLPLSTTHEPFYFSFSPFPHHTFGHHNGTLRHGADQGMSSASPGLEDPGCSVDGFHLPELCGIRRAYVFPAYCFVLFLKYIFKSM